MKLFFHPDLMQLPGQSRGFFFFLSLYEIFKHNKILLYCLFYVNYIWKCFKNMVGLENKILSAGKKKTTKNQNKTTKKIGPKVPS